MAEKRVTINDIARLAGTSTATVSHYINGKFDRMSDQTKARIAQVIEETGYSPNARAQSLSTKSSKVIAVLIENNTNLWAGQLVRGVEGVAHEQGYQTVVCDTHFNPAVESSYVEKMLSLGVDGFVIQPTNRYRGVRKRLENAGVPVVFYDFNLADLACTWVKTDLYGGVYDAIATCVDKGYEDFVVIAADQEKARTRAERLHGFEDALAERGLSYQTIPVEETTLSIPELRHRFEFGLKTNRRSLVFCIHPWALGATFKALSGMRDLMPQTVGLLGISSEEWTDLTDPSISAIVEPVEQEGRIACTLLLDLLENPDAVPCQRMLNCETRWRESTM
jgi:DNA-binding LacI/PurR family transcriptional regulator